MSQSNVKQELEGKQEKHPNRNRNKQSNQKSNNSFQDQNQNEEEQQMLASSDENENIPEDDQKLSQVERDQDFQTPRDEDDNQLSDRVDQTKKVSNNSFELGQLKEDKDSQLQQDVQEIENQSDDEQYPPQNTQQYKTYEECIRIHEDLIPDKGINRDSQKVLYLADPDQDFDLVEPQQHYIKHDQKPQNDTRKSNAKRLANTPEDEQDGEQMEDNHNNNQSQFNNDEQPLEQEQKYHQENDYLEERFQQEDKSDMDGHQEQEKIIVNEEQLKIKKVGEENLESQSSSLIEEQTNYQEEDKEVQDINALLEKYNQMILHSNIEIERKIIQISIDQLKLQLKQIEAKQVTQVKVENNQSPNTVNVKQQVRQNLFEIYQFYAKQTFVNGKQMTFEKLQHISNILQLGKFMYFCRDFKLIDLSFEIGYVIEECKRQGIQVTIIKQSNPNPQRKIAKLPFSQPRRHIADKQYLVEVFKKNAANSQEVTFLEFEVMIAKIASFLFQVLLEQLVVITKEDDRSRDKPSSLILFLQFIKIFKQSEYRSLMQIVGIPFDMKDKPPEKITQEKLKQKAKILRQASPAKPPLKPKPAEVIPQQIFEEFNENEFVIKQTNKIKSQQKVKNQNQNPHNITWDDLNQTQLEQYLKVNEFDPKVLLQDLDLEDSEDQIYLQEYMLDTKQFLTKPQTKEVQQVSEVKAEVQPSTDQIQNPIIRKQGIPIQFIFVKAKSVDKISTRSQNGYGVKHNTIQKQDQTLLIKVKEEITKHKEQEKLKQQQKESEKPKLQIPSSGRYRKTEQSNQRIRSGSLQKSVNKSSKDYQSRAAQLELMQQEKEYNTYQTLLRNQTQKEQKMAKRDK